MNPTNTTPRNIKANYGWLWQEKTALRLIAEHYTSNARQLVARSVYLALTEIASDQHTPTQARAACAYIGQRAAVTEGTARRYLHELAALDLVAIDTAASAFNTYRLLAIDVPPADDLAAATMPLADRKGISSAPLDVAEGITSAPLDRARGITPAPQYNKDLPKNKKQQTTGMVVVLADSTAERAGTELHSAHSGEEPMADEVKVYVAQEAQPDPQAGEAVRELAATGVHYEVAKQTVALYGAAVVLAWIAYALANRDSVKRPAGFVLKMVRSGQSAPAATPRTEQAGAVAWATRHGLISSGLDASKYLPGGKYGHLFNRDV